MNRQCLVLILTQFIFSEDSSGNEDIEIIAKIINNILRKIPRIQTFLQVIELYNDKKVSMNITLYILIKNKKYVENFIQICFNYSLNLVFVFHVKRVIFLLIYSFINILYYLFIP